MSEAGSSSTSASTAGATGGEASTQAAQTQGAAAEAAAAETKSEESQNEAVKEEDEKAAGDTKKAEKKETPAKEEGAEQGDKKEAPPHRYHERLTKAFPDRKFEKPEDYDTAMDEHLTNLEGYMDRGKKANQKLLGLFESEPAVGEMVRDMMNGASFREAVARHFSADDFTAVDGDPDYEGWQKNAKERDEKMNKRRDYEKTYAENVELSQKEVEAWGKENNMDDKTMDEFLGKIEAVLDDFHNGKITKDTLMLMQRAFNYDKDIEDAKKDARVAGRNEKIVAEKEKQPEQTGDGLPRPDKASDAPKEGPENYFEGLRNRLKERDRL